MYFSLLNRKIELTNGTKHATAHIYSRLNPVSPTL